VTAKVHYGWVVAGATALVLLSAAGMRGVLPVYFVPMERELGWTREALSYVGALSILAYGLSQPYTGGLCDRYGPRVVLTVAAALCGLGALGMSASRDFWLFSAFTVGLVATGAGAASMTAGTSVAARWFQARRGLVVGIAGAGVSAGSLVVIPLADWLTVEFGWRAANAALGVALLALILPVTAWLVRSDPADVGLRPYGDDGSPRSAAAAASDAMVTPIRQAVRHPGFWLLAGSFAICGYTSFGIIGVHLIPHAIDEGFTSSQAAGAVALMGALNIVGTLGSGWICDRLGNKRPLAFFYFARGLALLILLWIPNLLVLDLWAVAFGLNYIATVPPTSALTAQLFGRRSVGAIFGWISLSHQIGAALGAAVGGLTHRLFHNYDFLWVSAFVLAVAAAAMALAVPTPEAPTDRLAPEPPRRAKVPAGARA
jgi:MFS family permease